MAKKKPEPPFNNPFGRVKLAGEAAGKATTKAAPPAPKKKHVPSDDEAEAALFLEAVGEVRRVREPAKHPRLATPRTVEEVPVPNDEAESLARLAELVSGEGPFDLADSPEFVEGSVRGLDTRVLRKLRTGAFSLQGHLDLHGLTSDEAKAALEPFITRSRVSGLRCVLVVHGRGLHSPDQIPVLKQRVQVWLSYGRLAKYVLAFCSARPEDGGAGAVYVLLRR